MLESVLSSIAAYVHAHATIVSIATAIVILATLLGDALDLVVYAIQKGWRALSINVAFSVLAADPANATAAGAAALGFLGALGAGAGYRDAAIAALAAIGTVNTGYLLGADRTKITIVIAWIQKRPVTAAA